MIREAAATSLTVRKALRVIREFSVDGPTLPVTEIARRLGMPKSTASRLVAALCADGYLRKTPAGTCALGLKFVDYGSLAASTNAIRSLARPEMIELRRMLGVSTHLSILSPTRDIVIHIDRLRAGELERFPLSPSDRVPLHATSSGKAHLAFCAEAEIERVTRTALEKFTAATAVNPQRLLRELHAVRTNGFALGRDEFISGVSSVAVPIFGAHGEVVAALSVTGLSHQLNDRFLRRATTRLNGAVSRLSTQLHRQ